MKPGEGTERGDTDERGNLGENNGEPLSNQGLRGVQQMFLKETFVAPLSEIENTRSKECGAQTIVQCLSRNAQQLGGHPLVSECLSAC